MKINLVYNTKIADYSDFLSIVEQTLIKNKTEFKSIELESLSNWGDFTLVIGGDGTFIRAAKYYSEYNIPVLGLNVGRLGFLAQAQVGEIEQVLNNIVNNDFYTEDRMMLKSGKQLALNDFVIRGCNPLRTSKIYLDINGKQVCDYIADGLIVSTPTGSTAYGLSAGGPVLYPTLDCISIVPICPHTLNARPLIVPKSEKITVLTADEPLSVCVDGINTYECDEKIDITTSDNKAQLAFLEDKQFYSVLRNKLHWGISPENS